MIKDDQKRAKAILESISAIALDVAQRKKVRRQTLVNAIADIWAYIEMLDRIVDPDQEMEDVCNDCRKKMEESGE